jgi:dTDP-4-amino-4,6-dideoxygalactose transaminase
VSRPAPPPAAAEPLLVTRPDLPPLAELLPALESIWASRQLTNQGPFHQRLEEALARHLDVPALSLFCNGTVALLAALRTLALDRPADGGEVITTPYSFVATAHVLRWVGLTPVFVDIDPATFALDPRHLEAARTPRTRAVMPVHVYGYPCDTAAIDAFAQRHDLKVLYDAAHAFGVRTAGPGLLRAGNLTVLSFHATKVFHTFEGGAVVCADERTKRQLDRIRNFGFVDEVTVDSIGINGKMNELQAAVGLLQLPRLELHRQRRAAIDTAYREGLADLASRGQVLLPPVSRADAHNHGYFPLRVTAAFTGGRDGLYQRLRTAGIHARRYFHPLITEFPMYTGMPGAGADRLPVATQVAREIICLPMHGSLSDDDIERVLHEIHAAA